MSRPRGWWLALVVLIAALTALAASIGWAAGSPSAWRNPSGWPGGMMAPTRPGAATVDSLADAGQAAQRFADPWGLQVGEVMRFDNGFYAELLDPAGNGATEVLIDPASGAVQLEWGPAMMWNTAFGMMPGTAQPGTPPVGADQARQLADRWLRDNRTDLHANQAERFPGYYTLHVLRGEQIVGMLSVHAGTGAVWFHTWHGRFIEMREHPAAK